MKNKKRKINAGLIFVTICVLYFSYIFIQQQGMISSKNREVAQVQENIIVEKKKAVILNNQLSQVNSDNFIEAAAREKLGLVKDGEKIFVDINK